MKKGDKVEIMNQTISGKSIFEGIATLVAKIDEGLYEEIWQVKFPEDPDLYQRRIKK